MQKTTNYQLPKWEKTDRIQMKDFNDMTAALDAALAEKTAAVFGTYTGNGASTYTVSLGFTPKLLFTCTCGGIAGYNSGSAYTYGALAAPGHPVIRSGSTAAIEIVEGGFTLCQSNDYDRVNHSNTVYHYIAFR